MISNAGAQEDNVVYWPYFSYPPLFMVEEGREPYGPAIEIQDLLISHMPQYKHVRLDAPPARMFQNILDGQQYALVGAVKTPERQKSMIFTLPCRIAFHDHVVVRADEVERFGGGPTVSLEYILADTSLSFGHLSGASYGVEVDVLVEMYQGRPDFMQISGTNAMEQLLKMLDMGRVDFIMSDPTALMILSRKLGFEDRFAVLFVQEQKETALPGYVVLPKTDWGREMAATINDILTRAAGSGELEKILSSSIPASNGYSFEDLYREQILDHYPLLIYP